MTWRTHSACRVGTHADARARHGIETRHAVCASQVKPKPATLADLSPQLAQVVEALRRNAAARLLDADRAQVSRWTSGKEAIGSEMSRRIANLHGVLTRILRVYRRETAAMWLVGSEPLLGGARPIDVLAIEGAGPVVRAIDGIAEGAYA